MHNLEELIDAALTAINDRYFAWFAFGMGLVAIALMILRAAQP